MKYKLLAVSTNAYVNIGDYVQALASRQFLPSCDGFIQRERLDDYEEEECGVIMNGWYMHEAEHWPPSPLIDPLFLAVHINILAESKLLSLESLQYFKRYQPIGCRDFRTQKMLQDHGVDAYFSGCMTLTLGKTYHSDIKDNKYYFVDAPYDFSTNCFEILKNIWVMISNWRVIKKISLKHPDGGNNIKRFIVISSFYRIYSKLFSDDILEESEYYCQQNEYYKNAFETDEDRLKEAEKLIKKYARAKLVVTSRIHCALPCLGIETPVLYIKKDSGDLNDCRLDGLIELFNIVEYNNKGLVKPDFVSMEKISCATLLKNKDTWKPLAKNMVESIDKWLRNKKVLFN